MLPNEDQRVITFYEQATGRIKGFLVASEDTIQLNKEKSADPCVEGLFTEDTHYVDQGKIKLREENPVRIEGNVLINVPQASQIKINNTTYQAEDTRVELFFDQPGTYTITIESWPYLNRDFEYEATPQ